MDRSWMNESRISSEYEEGVEQFLQFASERGRPDEDVMQSYPRRALDRRLKVDWARDAREGPKVLTSLKVYFGPMV